MINDKRSGISLGCGYLLIVLGSIPLGQYPILLLWPTEFYHDPSTGSVPYLYLWLFIGLILWLMGTVLIILGTKKAGLVLMIGLAGIGVGCLIWMPSFINANDHKGALGFLAASASWVIFTGAILAMLNVYRKMMHRTA